MDKYLIINAIVAVAAVLMGLYSHKFTAALAAWFWLAAVHSGLILLVMGQAGSLSVPQLPMLGDVLAIIGQAVDAGIKFAQAYVPFDFANTALAAYFVATVGILFVLVIASFIISSILTGLVSLLVPRKAQV